MTLRRKIVSLTLCLLLLFMATAAASLLLQSEISEQFSGVVDDYLPLNAAVATIDVFTDRYELDLMRLAARLRDAGAGAGALAHEGEPERLREAGVLTTTFSLVPRRPSGWETKPAGTVGIRASGATGGATGGGVPAFRIGGDLDGRNLPGQRNKPRSAGRGRGADAGAVIYDARIGDKFTSSKSPRYRQSAYLIARRWAFGPLKIATSIPPSSSSFSTRRAEIVGGGAVIHFCLSRKCCRRVGGSTPLESLFSSADSPPLVKRLTYRSCIWTCPTTKPPRSRGC